MVYHDGGRFYWDAEHVRPAYLWDYLAVHGTLPALPEHVGKVGGIDIYADKTMPRDTIEAYSDGKLVGRITNVG